MRFSIVFLIIINLCLFSLSHLLSIAGVEVFKKQLFIWFLGIILFFSGLLIKYRHIFYFPYLQILILLSILGLVVVLFLPGYPKSWIRLGSFSIQTSEFAKIGLFLVLTNFLTKYTEYLRLSFFVILLTIQIAPFLILLSLQPDAGMMILYFLIIILSILAFLTRRTIVFGFIFFLIFLTVAWLFLLKPYQKERILNFLDINRDPLQSGYNLRMVKITLGSAGFFGKGIGGGTISRLGFLPARDTDFILTSVFEERGIFGFLIYSLLIIILLWEIRNLNVLTQNPLVGTFSYIVIIYFSAKFILTTLINVGLSPIIGLPVPFLSAGGSHLIFDLWLLGILLSFSKESV